MFIHPLLPRVTQSGCNPTSCRLPPKPTPSAVSGNHRRTCIRAVAGHLHRLRAVPPRASPTLLKFQAPEAKSRGVSGEPSSLPALTHTAWLSLGTLYVEYKEVFMPKVQCHSRGHCSPAFNACSGASGTMGVSISSMCVHTNMYTQRRMATGPEGDRLLFLDLKRLI